MVHFFGKSPVSIKENHPTVHLMRDLIERIVDFLQKINRKRRGKDEHSSALTDLVAGISVLKRHSLVFTDLHVFECFDEVGVGLPSVVQVLRSRREDAPAPKNRASQDKAEGRTWLQRLESPSVKRILSVR